MPQPDDWLTVEFEQNFEQLRDRDDRMIGLAKFYITSVLSFGSVAAALMALQDLCYRYSMIGMLLIGVFIAGEILLLWMTSVRIYFVTCARQLNAIRNWYSQYIPPAQRSCIVQPTDSSLPLMIHGKSAHVAAIALMTFVNAALATLGANALMAEAEVLTFPLKFLVSTVTFAIIIVINVIWIWRRLRESP